MSPYVAIWCLLALTVSTEADDLLGAGGLVYAPGHASVDYYAYPKYAFEYSVKDPHTGDNKAQWEKRDGDVVKGAYSLVEPDGHLRVVEYWADDKSGFNAVVKRLGPNTHPTPISAPIYKAPIPMLSPEIVAAPISVGPVAKYAGLAGAPLFSGYDGGAVSSQSLYKPAPIAVASPVPIIAKPSFAISPAPIYSAPIIKSTPYLAPISPITKSNPYLAPISPILKPSPVLYNEPAYKAPLLASPYNYFKGPLVGYDNLGLGLLKGPSYSEPWNIGLKY